MISPYLTTSDAAALLGVTSARVRQLIACGIIDAAQHGRSYLILPESIKAARKRPGRGWPKGKPRKKL